jgi:hypothetical protein
MRGDFDPVILPRANGTSKQTLKIFVKSPKMSLMKKKSGNSRRRTICKKQQCIGFIKKDGCNDMIYIFSIPQIPIRLSDINLNMLL